jgi:MYXO-CTERM domain-containing protein
VRAASGVTEGTGGARLRSLAAVAAVVAVTTYGLASVLAVPTGRITPAVVAAAVPALLAAAFAWRRAAAAAMLVAVPATLLAAGTPVGGLSPGAWPRLVDQVRIGAWTPIAAAGRWTLTPASLAVLVLMAGALWTAGTALGTPPVRPRDQLSGNPLRLRGDALRRLAGFGLLAAPWLGVLSVRSAAHSAWPGAVVLVAGVLWFCGGRAAPALAALVSVPAVLLATAAGPHTHWFGLAGHQVGDPLLRTLALDPTYGPLPQPGKAATMLTVTAPAPGLWRMATLDYANGSWILDGNTHPRLPEPAARPESVRVRVVGLRENLVVAPGRIDRVSAAGTVASADGEGRLIEPMPLTGDSYRVAASVVRVTARQLSGDAAPLSAGARTYTRLVPPRERGTESQALSWLLAPLMAVLHPAHPAALDPHMVALARRLILHPTGPAAIDPRVVALARRLARGARTEWKIVMRVERYLLGGHFRYTTNVPAPGPQPLVDFLLDTHAGYCQHFAGAAALLLRLAGVPARVVTGFATGRRVGLNRYLVRDVDAHEWIEVYFQGYGWVPFNPTPAADPAVITGGIDPHRSAQPPTHVPEQEYLAAGLMAMLAAGAAVGRRRRRGVTASGDSLWRVARLAGAPPGASTTLAQARAVLAARIGPRTAAIADELERQRFAAQRAAAPKHPRIRLARALLGDLGPARMLLLLCVPRRRVSSAPGDGPDGRSGTDRSPGQAVRGPAGAS